MTCDHPKECHADGFCAWCMDLKTLHQTIENLRNQFRKQAIVVHDGSPVIHGPVGYLEVRGGQISLQPYDAATRSGSTPEDTTATRTAAVSPSAVREAFLHAMYEHQLKLSQDLQGIGLLPPPKP